MFKKFRAQGFVLKEKEIDEADLLFFVFSREFGRLDLLAKSARKISSKLRREIEIFSLVEIGFIEGKKGERLVETKTLNRFSRIKNDLERLFLAQKISEVSDLLIRGSEKEEKIFELFKETFDKLNSFSFEKKELLFCYFFWNLIFILGFFPNLNECAFCNKKIKEDCFFSFGTGQILCRKCKRLKFNSKEKIFPLDFSTIKLLKLTLRRNFNFLERIKTPKKVLKQCLEFSEKWLNFVLEKNEF
jgi:DNA repair protein RecO (recombination protein O)